MTSTNCHSQTFRLRSSRIFSSIGFKYSSLIAKLPVRLCDGWVDVNSFWCLIKRGGIPYQVIDIVISSCTINVITCSLSVRLYPKLLHRAPHITSPYRLLGLLHVHWTAAFYVTNFISFHIFGMQVWLPWLFSTSYIIKQKLMKFRSEMHACSKCVWSKKGDALFYKSLTNHLSDW